MNDLLKENNEMKDVIKTLEKQIDKIRKHGLQAKRRKSRFCKMAIAIFSKIFSGGQKFLVSW